MVHPVGPHLFAALPEDRRCKISERRPRDLGSRAGRPTSDGLTASYTRTSSLHTGREIPRHGSPLIIAPTSKFRTYRAASSGRLDRRRLRCASPTYHDFGLPVRRSRRPHQNRACTFRGLRKIRISARCDSPNAVLERLSAPRPFYVTRHASIQRQANEDAASQYPARPIEDRCGSRHVRHQSTRRCSHWRGEVPRLRVCYLQAAVTDTPVVRYLPYRD